MIDPFIDDGSFLTWIRKFLSWQLVKVYSLLYIVISTMHVTLNGLCICVNTTIFLWRLSKNLRSQYSRVCSYAVCIYSQLECLVIFFSFKIIVLRVIVFIRFLWYHLTTISITASTKKWPTGKRIMSCLHLTVPVVWNFLNYNVLWKMSLSLVSCIINLKFANIN